MYKIYKIVVYLSLFKLNYSNLLKIIYLFFKGKLKTKRKGKGLLLNLIN